MDKLVYTAHEVAEILNIGMNKVYELLERNVIPNVKVGRRYIIPKQTLEKWLCECVKI